MTKTLLSYNVNGIRAAINKGFAEWLKEVSPDIVCIQEIKAGSAQIDLPLLEHLGYQCYINSAEKKGYSGVMTLSKEIPEKINIGIGIEKYDIEGRVLRTDYPGFTLINVYIPSGSMGDIRQAFKMEFLADFRRFIQDLRKEQPNLVICGDYNICHKAIDINHPERHINSSGFLPEERAWFDDFINDGLTDTFRMFNSEAEQYSWWSYRANSRMKNLGWRLDYHLVTESLKNNVADASIMSDVKHSDHCPVSLILDI